MTFDMFGSLAHDGRMATSLAALREETWGQRFRRARTQAGLNIREAAQLVKPYITTSHATLARLELNDERPGGRHAQLAFVALLAYGVDPAELDLADLPECRALDAAAILEDLEQRRLSSPFASTIQSLAA